MIAFGKDDSLCEWDGKNWMIRFAKDESLRGLDEWDGWLCWMIAFGKDDSLCEWDEFLRNG